MRKMANYKDKAYQLAEYLGISPNEIEVDGIDKYALYKTPDGTYQVMTVDEADEAHYEYTEEFIDEFGISGFTEYGQQYILENCMNDNWFEDAMRESSDNYAEAIKYESDNTYGNRLVAECVEDGIIDDFLDDFEESEYDDIDEYIEDNFDLDELAEEYGEYLYNDGMDNYDSAYEWYKFDFGADEASEMASKYCDIDIQAVSDFCIREDDYGNNLAPWDGATVDLPDYYAFKQDDYDERSEDFVNSIFDMDEDEIRMDFATALSKVEKGSDLSSWLGYGFSDEDISNLAKLHKDGYFREKIEDLLTDCNFHTESADFASGNYDEYIK